SPPGSGRPRRRRVDHRRERSSASRRSIAPGVPFDQLPPPGRWRPQRLHAIWHRRGAGDGPPPRARARPRGARARTPPPTRGAPRAGGGVAPRAAARPAPRGGRAPDPPFPTAFDADSLVADAFVDFYWTGSHSPGPDRRSRLPEVRAMVDSSVAQLGPAQASA